MTTILAMSASGASQPFLSRIVFWIAIAVCAVVLVGFRLHAFDLPLETDECNYAYISGRLLEGDRLYVDVWDHQPPGVFVLFAGVIALFGDAPEVFRWTAIAFSLLSLVLMAALARRVAGIWAAMLAALLFALVSSDPGTGGEGVNREIYMNTLIVAGWWCALAGLSSERVGGDAELHSLSRRAWWWLFASGLSLGIGSLIKTVVAVHWLALAIWLAANVHWRTPEPHRPRGHGSSTTSRGSAAAPSGAGAKREKGVLLAILAFGAGPLALWAGSFGYFAATGRLGEFVDAVFLFNLSYSEGGGLLSRFITFLDPPRHPFVFQSAGPLWLTAALATAWLAARAMWYRSREASLVLALIVAAFIAVCLPAHFWPHYYYLLVPTCVMAVSVLLSDLSRKIVEHHRSLFGRAEAAVLLLLVPISVTASEYDAYLSQPPFGITVERYNSRDFWGRAQGENVRRVTNPDDTVFVFGNEAEIYYYSGRRCASRYTMITGLAEGMAGAEQRRASLLNELRAHPPRLILLLFDQPPFEDWKQFLSEYYTEQPVGADLHDRTGETIMLVLARKDAPIEPIDWNWDRSQVGGWQLGERP